MNNKFISQLASDVLKQNHHWKDKYIKIQLRLKDFQQKMMRTLLDCGYQQANSIIDPYQLLSSFCNSLSKSQHKIRTVMSQNIQIKSQINQLDATNKNITQEKQELQLQLRKLQNQMQKASRYQIAKTKVLQERIQQLKTLRQKNHAQIEKLRKKNQTQVAELISDHRERVHDLVARHKMDMMQYRKTVQEDAWKMQSSLRSQIDLKNEELKKLVGNFDRMKKSEKVNDWSVLQNLMKPYKETAVFIQKISQLRKQIASIKADNRNHLNKYLQLQIQNSSLKNEHQKLKEQKNLLSGKFDILEQQYQESKQQLVIQKQDKVKLTKYYDEKWIQQFNQVRINLQKKYTQKTQNCERQYIERKRQVDQENSTITQENKKLRTQVKEARDRLIQKQKKIQAQVKVRLNLIDKLYQIRSAIRQSQCMFHQDITAHLIREKQEIQFLQSQIQEIQYQTKQIQQQHNVKIAQKESLFKDTLYQVKKEQFQKRKEIQTELEQVKQESFKKQVQLRRTQVEQKKFNQRVRIQYEMKLEKKLQAERQKLRSQIQERITENTETQKKLWVKVRENQKNWKQAHLQKQQIKRFYQDRQEKLKITFQEYQKTIEKYKQQLNQVVILKFQHKVQLDALKNKLYDSQVEIKSLNVMIQSKQARIYSLNIQLKEIVRQKINWGKMLKNSKLQFQEGFRSIKENCDKLIAFYKGRIWQMQRMLENNPISQKDFTKIKSLTEQNKSLYDKIQIKEAQNIILHQVKSYYESKVHENQLQQEIKNQKRNVSVFVKRPTKKRQGLISLKQTAVQRSAIFDTKEVSDLRRYIRTKQRENVQHKDRPFSLSKTNFNSGKRNKSSMS